MGLLARVRQALISNEMADGAGTELRADRRGALWVTLADALSASIVDANLSFVAGGQTTSANPAVQVATGQSGSGYLTIVNTDTSNAVQLGLTGVTSTGFSLPAGASVTWRLSDVSTIKVYGSGAVVSWAVLR
jgi:hypothetical protein